MIATELEEHYPLTMFIYLLVPICPHRRIFVAEKAKQNQTPAVVPENAKNLQYLGCFIQRTHKGQLAGYKFESRSMTPSNCVTICATRSYSAAGLQNGNQCFCGRADNLNGAVESECNQQCSGDNKFKCGGTTSLSVYDTGFKEGSINGKYIGCYVDPSEESRLMSAAVEDFKGRLNNRICQQFCKLKGYRFSGTGSGYRCFCTQDRPPHMSLTDDEECNAQCEGSAGDVCGGTLRISAYDTSEGGDDDPVKSLYEGCLPSSVFGSSQPKSSNLLTSQYCVGFCYKRGYRLAGLMLGNECHCDNEIQKVPSVNDDFCNMPCPGNRLQKCGSRSHISVYRTGLPDPRVNPNFSYLGCYFDFQLRILNGASYRENGLTKQKCIKFCFDRAYYLAGMESGTECFCGITVAQDTRPLEHECGTPCGGDRTQKCGGNWRISVYDTGLHEYRKAEEQRCIPSETRVKEEPACKGKVVFMEDFNTRTIDPRVWQHSVIMPAAPDYEFVIYNQKPANSFVRDGSLVIKPTLLDDYDVQNGVMELKNCTGYLNSEECSRQAAAYNILPPVESAMLSTKESFHFKYGRVEIRAKLPLGDWLVPALWLEPKKKSYGTFYSSGRIVLALARGNSELMCGPDDMGNNRLEAGITPGIHVEPLKKSLFWKSKEEWSHRYHTYALNWTSDSISFSVDGAQEKILLSKGQKVRDLFDGDKAKSAPWAFGSSIAPFDEEFYISLGLYAGGMTDFKDDCLCRGSPKPWQNFGTKALGHFWQAKKDWHKTWHDDSSSLKVDYIKVTAI